MVVSISTAESMKGTKVLTLGEGLGACYTCVRMRGTVISGLVH